MQSRYYDPEVGRFINLDDTEILFTNYRRFLGSNLFVYCQNNSVNYTDATGEWGVKDHVSISKNFGLDQSFTKRIDYYNKLCDNKDYFGYLKGRGYSYPFHSRDEKRLKNSILKLYSYIKKDRLKEKARIFNYKDLFSDDGFTCILSDGNKNKSDVVKGNNILLRFINFNSNPFSTAYEQRAMLIGMCLHMIQDYFAHRILVKATTSDNKINHKKYIPIASLDEEISKKYPKFNRCAIEDNTSIFSWRFTNAKIASQNFISALKK